MSKDQATLDAFADPKPGYRFHEMYSVWFNILAVEGEVVLERRSWGTRLECVSFHVFRTRELWRKSHRYESQQGVHDDHAYMNRFADGDGKVLEGYTILAFMAKENLSFETGTPPFNVKRLETIQETLVRVTQELEAWRKTLPPEKEKTNDW